MELDIYKKIFNSLNVGIVVMRFDDINDVVSLRTVAINPAGNSATRAQSSTQETTGALVVQTAPALQASGILDQWAELLKKKESKDLGNVHYAGDDNLTESWFATYFHTLSEDTFYLEFTNITKRIEAEEEMASALEKTKQLNEYMIDRELKMVELKAEIKRLQEKISSKT